MKELNSYLKFKAQLAIAEESYSIDIDIDPLVEGLTTKVNSLLISLLKELDITEELFMNFLDSCKKAKVECIATCIIEKVKNYHRAKKQKSEKTKDEKLVEELNQTILTNNKPK